MTLKRLLGRIRVSKVPQEDYGRVVIRGRCQELGRVVWIPSQSTDWFPVVVKSQGSFLGLEIPDSDEAAGTTSGKNVRDLAVPSQAFDVVRSRRGGTQTEGVRNIVDIVDEKLAFGASCRKNLRLDGVELNRLDSTGVLDGLGKQCIGAPSYQLLGIPEVQ